jgi:hypothetical protein
MFATRIHVVHESRCPEIGPICQERDEPPQLHDQVLNVAELRALIEYGFTRTFGIEAQIPIRMVDTGIVYRRLGGMPFEPDYGNIHHRDETLFGFSDPWLRGRASFLLMDLVTTFYAGVSLPLGKVEKDPFQLGEAGVEHQHVQFGTGTVDPVLSVSLSHRVGAIDGTMHAHAKLVLYENRHGFRAGNRYGAGLIATADLWDWLRIGLTADLANEQPDRWQGEIHQDGNLGRTDLLLGAAATLFVGGIQLDLAFKVPAFVRILMHEAEPGEVTYPGIFSLSVGKGFAF